MTLRDQPPGRAFKRLAAPDVRVRDSPAIPAPRRPGQRRPDPLRTDQRRSDLRRSGPLGAEPSASPAPRRRSATPRVSVVVPARNEARNLELVLPALAAQPCVTEVVVVDGHSVDGTLETAARVMPGATLVTQTRRGKGNALACGFAAVTGDVIVMFDADGSADPGEIPAFVAALVAGADVAKGSRFAPGGGSDDITALRRCGNAGLNAVANGLFGTAYSDLCYGYNAFWADVVDVLDLPPTTTPDGGGPIAWGDGFEIETILNCRVAAAGLRVTEVASVERARVHGATNLRTFADGTRVLRTLAAERRRAKFSRER